ncbi:DUF2663 family protein [Bacillus marinisedimentorum]|uniref:DUF2663 family protein n=1 Tax=Bacillus marinisedimentorum TaxID=1821260 RepID=UPI000872B1BA|nr:DUF2663 family protein [Bacillus marinisedimentorum]
MAVVPYVKSDLVAREAVNTLVGNKESLDKVSKRSVFFRWMLAVSAIFYAAYLALFLSYSPGSDADLIGDIILGRGNLLFLFILAVQYAVLLTYKMKEDMAKEEYENLRIEIISRSEEFWKTEDQWKERAEVFRYLKDFYEINLFHEN